MAGGAWTAAATTIPVATTDGSAKVVALSVAVIAAVMIGLGQLKSKWADDQIKALKSAKEDVDKKEREAAAEELQTEK